MGEPLKTFFSGAVVADLAHDLRRAGLDPSGFAAEATEGLDALELLDRGRHIAKALRRRLPDDPTGALAALVRTLGPTHTTDELLGVGMAPFKYFPHTVLIAELGPLAPEAGLEACREVTRRFSAESCVRPILEAHPALAWAAIDRWVTDPDPHVRRLVSEGLRPRLPWAPRLRGLMDDPRPALARLERLVDDPAELVRRSVANHLGDVAKDHPDLAVETARRWIEARPAREKLVRHALRWLLKQGHPGAFAVLGFAPPRVRVEGFHAPARARLGDSVSYAFELVSEADDPQRVRVHAVVTFPMARGTGDKVFELGTVELAPGERRTLSGRVRLHEMTTRTHRPGVHQVTVQVNGARFPGGAFEVADGREL